MVLNDEDADLALLHEIIVGEPAAEWSTRNSDMGGDDGPLTRVGNRATVR